MSMIDKQASGVYAEKSAARFQQFCRWSSRCPRSSSRRAFAAVSVAAIAMLSHRSAKADVYWDPTYTKTTNGGGIGSWTTTATNWYNGTTDVSYDGTNTYFGGGPAGNYNVSLYNSFNVTGNLTFNNTSSAVPTIYNLVAPNVSGTVLTSVLNLTGASPTITVNGTSFNSSSYTATGSFSSGYAMIGNSQNSSIGTTAGVYLNSSTGGFTLNGGGELILANALYNQSGSTVGTITVNGGSTLTVGNRTQPVTNYVNPTTPYTFLHGDSVVLNGSALQIATTASLTATTGTTMQIGPISVSGNSEIDIYRVASSASTSIQFVNSPLTLAAGSNINFLETGNTQSTGSYMQFPSATVSVPGGDIAGNDSVTINATQNSNYTKVENPNLGIYTDNGVNTYFLGGGNLTTLSGEVTMNGSSGANNSASGNWIIGNAAGTAGVSVETASSSGTTQTLGTNIYRGSLTSGNSITVNPYSALYIYGIGFYSYGSSSQTITINGVGATLYNASNNTVTGGNAGELEFGSATTSGTGTANYLESNIVLESGTTPNIIAVNSNTSSQIDGNISPNTSAGTPSLEKYGNGTLYLNGTNSWTGGTYISQGTLVVSSNSSLGTYSSVSGSPLTLGSNTTNYNTSLVMYNTAQTVGSLSSMYNASSGTYNNTIVLNGTALDIVQTVNGTFSPGALTTLTSTISGTGSIMLDSRSTATLTFGGANTYSGGTNIAGGSLFVKNTTGSALGSGPVTIANAIFGGTGIVTGPVTASNTNFSFGTITGSHIPGTLNLSGGASITGGTLNYYLNTPSNSDLLTTANSALNFAGTTTVNLFNLGAVDTGVYTLATYNDTTAPNISGLTFGTGLGGFNYNLSASTTALSLNVSVAAGLTWGLSGNGNWDSLGQFNWNNGSGALVQFNNSGGNSVVFDDTSGGTSSIISLVGTLTPTLIDFANNSKGYNVSGSGVIGGTTDSLIVRGTGTVILASTNASGNTFAGGTVAIDGGGTLEVTSNALLGALTNQIVLSSQASFAQPSTIEFLNTNTSSRSISLFGTGGAVDTPSGVTLTLAGPIAGSGGLLKTDLGTLVLSNTSNGYLGATNVSAGTLQLVGAGSIPSTSALIVGSGATFLPGLYNNSVASIAGAGTIQFNTSGAAVLTVGTNNTSTVFSGPITGAGAISMAGSGKLTMNSSSSTFSGGLLVSNSGLVVGGTTASSLGTGNFNLSGGGELQIHAPIIAGTQTLYVGSGGAQFNASGNNVSLASLVGTGSVTYYGGNTNLSLGTTVASNVSAAVVIGKTGDGGGNNLIITKVDTLGNSPFGVDIAPYPSGETNFITINPAYNTTLGSPTSPPNTLVLGTGNTAAGGTGVQMGFNTTAGAITPFMGYNLGNPAISQFNVLSNLNFSGTSTPGILLRDQAQLVGKGFAAYNGGNLTVDDGANVAFSVPSANDFLIEDSAVRNNDNGAAASLTTQINVTGQGLVDLTSGAVSAGGKTQYQGVWNVALGAGGAVGSGVIYTNTSSGTLVVGAINGTFGEPLNAFGFFSGAPTGINTPVNLYSGLLALGVDQADPASSTILAVNSFRDSFNIAGGAIASTGFEYTGTATSANNSYALVGTNSSAGLVSANIAGNINIIPGATGTLLTYDPLNPSTGGRNLNFTTNGTSVAGNITWGYGSSLVISSNGTTGGAISFGRTTGTVTVNGNNTMIVGSGSTVNIGFVPGVTGVGTVTSGIDPLTDSTYGNSVNVTVNGAINWGGRTSLTGDAGAGFKQYGVGQLTINNGGIATLNTADQTSDRSVLNAAELYIAGTGTVNLKNNDMIVQSVFTGSSLQVVTQYVAAGYNKGAWNGSGGITSSTAAADTTHLHAIGVILNDNGMGTNTPLYPHGFDGATEVTPDFDVLLKYTYYGDTDLNGEVDGSDYSRVDAAYLAEQTTGTTATGWFNGDFNYDGVVNGSDYTLMDNAFNTQGAQIAAEVAAPSAIATDEIAGATGSSAVPEPTMMGLLAIAGTGLLGRRRHQAR